VRLFLQRNLFFWHTLFRPYQAFVRLWNWRFFRQEGISHLTHIQKRYLILDEKKSLIVAGAGTGKTTTIVAKVDYLRKVKKVPEEKILSWNLLSILLPKHFYRRLPSQLCFAACEFAVLPFRC
jgi:hypothetical protein